MNVIKLFVFLILLTENAANYRIVGKKAEIF